MPRAMVLCAGLGTRLKPLTDELPKPLVPIGDRPVLQHIVEALRAEGIDELVVNAHHLSDELIKFIRYIHSKIHVIHEPVIRGTAGGIAGAKALLDQTAALIWNGDILTKPPVKELLRRAQTGGLVLAIALRPSGHGTVGLDEAGRVVRLRGEHFGTEASGGDYVGVAALGAQVLKVLPERGCLIGDVALPLLRAGGAIETASSPAPFYDVGDLTGYWRANVAWLEASGARSSVARDATVAQEVELDRAIVGAGAHVDGHGLFARCVVWPGARASAPLADTVVTRRALVSTAQIQGL